MGLIGMTVGFIGFFLHQLMDLISKFKWDKASKYLDVSFKIQKHLILILISFWNVLNHFVIRNNGSLVNQHIGTITITSFYH